MNEKEYTQNERVTKAIFIEGLLKVRNWFFKKDAFYLRSIFDQAGFTEGYNTAACYVKPIGMTSNVSYPVKKKSNVLDDLKTATLHEIESSYRGFDENYLNSLSANKLIFLLEKFGGTVPVEEDEHISIFDCYKIKAAKATIARNREIFKHEPNNLIINLDLSGIQGFIYNIASQGALKSLRSRSFFIEMLCNHAADRCIDIFNLHYINVLMNGGGNIYILSSKPSNYEELLDDIDYNLNSWLLKEFNGRLHIAFSSVEVSDEDLNGDISHVLKKISKASFLKKNQKFQSIIQRGEFIFIEEKDPTSYQCGICLRDCDMAHSQEKDDLGELIRCDFCDRLMRLGNVIPEIRYVYVSDKYTDHCLQIENSFYLLSRDCHNDLPCRWVIYNESNNFFDELGALATHLLARTHITTIAILPKDVRQSIFEEKTQLEALLSVAKSQEEKQYLENEIDSLCDENVAMLEHLAAGSEGAKLIGALRMDADNMGKILSEGFQGKTTLEKISSFSRNLNYFFRLYLESLCNVNISGQKRKELLVQIIYAGGDDLFALGAWNDIAELAVIIGKAFQEYTSCNIDLGLSGGFTIHKPKFPVNKMAALSLAALNKSKENLEPCWFCRKDWINCPLFRKDGKCLRKDSLTPFFSGHKSFFKSRLDKELDRKYSPEPSRLKLSFKWKQYDQGSKTFIDEVSDYIVRPLGLFTAENAQGDRYFAKAFLQNTLSLLDVWYKEGLIYMPKIAWLIQKIRGHIQNMIDKGTGKPLYDLCETYVHFASPNRLSTLHIPLSWAILLMRGGKETNESQANGRETFRKMEP